MTQDRESTHSLDARIAADLDGEATFWPPVATTKRRPRKVIGVVGVVCCPALLTAYGFRAVHLEGMDRSPDLAALMILIGAALAGCGGSLLIWSVMGMSQRQRLRRITGHLAHWAIRVLLLVLSTLAIATTLTLLTWATGVSEIGVRDGVPFFALVGGSFAVLMLVVLANNGPGLASLRETADGARVLAEARAWYVAVWAGTMLPLAMIMDHAGTTGAQAFGLIAAISTAVLVRAFIVRDRLDRICRAIVTRLDSVIDSALRSDSRTAASADLRCALQALESELAGVTDTGRFRGGVRRADLEVRSAVNYLTLRMHPRTRELARSRHPRFELLWGRFNDGEITVLTYRFAMLLRRPLLTGRMLRTR